MSIPGIDPTFAIELRDHEHEREVRAFIDALDIDYYILRNEGLNEGVTSYGVLVIHTADMISFGQVIAPRSS